MGNSKGYFLLGMASTIIALAIFGAFSLVTALKEAPRTQKFELEVEDHSFDLIMKHSPFSRWNGPVYLLEINTETGEIIDYTDLFQVDGIGGLWESSRPEFIIACSPAVARSLEELEVLYHDGELQTARLFDMGESFSLICE